MVRLLTPAAAADLLGVDTKTVGRYVDEGKLPATRTDGGHRRIAEPELLAFKARRDAAEIGACVVVVANQKGGVLKTTLTANLGVLLHQAGARVLLIDLDPQAHLGWTLGQNPDELTATVYDAMIRPQTSSLASVIQPSVFGPDIAPINIAASDVDNEFASKPLWGHFLRSALDPIRAQYDYILIDSAPNLGKLTVLSFLAGDYILIPSQLQMLSVRGLSLLLNRIDEAQAAGNSRLRIAGVVPTMVQKVGGDKAMDQALRQALRAAQGGRAIHVFATAIPYSAAYKDAANARTIMAYQSPRGRHTDPYRHLLAEILAVVGGPLTAESVLPGSARRAGETE